MGFSSASEPILSWLPSSRKRTASDAGLKSAVPAPKRTCFDIGYKTNITAETFTPPKKTKIVVVGKYRGRWLKAIARRETELRRLQARRDYETKVNETVLKLWEEKDPARYIPGIDVGPFPRYFAKMYIHHLSRRHVLDYLKQHIDPADYVELTAYCHWQWLKQNRRVGPDGHLLVRVVFVKKEEQEVKAALGDIPARDDDQAASSGEDRETTPLTESGDDSDSEEENEDDDDYEIEEDDNEDDDDDNEDEEGDINEDEDSENDEVDEDDESDSGY